MKNITIAGRLTKDAENRTAGSDNVTGFSVAVDDRQGKEKGTLYFDCNLWGKRGESLSPHLIKGSSVTVSGDLSTREHNGKTYLTVRVSDVTLQGGKPGARIDDFRDSMPGGVARGGTRSAAYDLNDDVPF
jgi:single-strand DNA-binding protein